MSKDTTPVPASSMASRVRRDATTMSKQDVHQLRDFVQWMNASEEAYNDIKAAKETAERDLAGARRERDELREIIAAAAAEKDTLRSQASAAEHRRRAAEHRAQRIVLDGELKARAEAAERERDTAQVAGWCDVCCGSGKPTSDVPCICGGSGLAADAVIHLRVRVLQAEQIIRDHESGVANLHRVIDALTKERDEALDVSTRWQTIAREQKHRAEAAEAILARLNELVETWRRRSLGCSAMHLHPQAKLLSEVANELGGAIAVEPEWTLAPAPEGTDIAALTKERDEAREKFEIAIGLTNKTLKRELSAIQDAQAAEAKLATLTKERDEWKEAVIDAAVVNWTYIKEHETNPRKAIAALLACAEREALDPAISEPAAKLVQRAEAAEAALVSLRAKIRAVSQNARARGARRSSEWWAAKAESALIANEIDAALTEASAETPQRCQCGAPLEWCCAHCAVDAMLTEPAAAKGTVSPAPATEPTITFGTLTVPGPAQAGPGTTATYFGGETAQTHFLPVPEGRPPQEDDNEHAWIEAGGRKWCHQCGATWPNTMACSNAPWPRSIIDSAGPAESQAVPEVRTPPPLKGIDGFVDELYEIPEGHHEKDHIRTVLLAFAAHVRRQVEAASPGAGPAPQAVTRFEVIDHRNSASAIGRVYSAWNCRIELIYQDGGKTLKVFVDGDRPPSGGQALNGTEAGR